jgi:hypothetical protein
VTGLSAGRGGTGRWSGVSPTSQLLVQYIYLETGAAMRPGAMEVCRMKMECGM